MDGCCSSMIKYFVFLSNLVIFFLGVVALGLGIFAIVDSDTLKDFINVIGASDAVSVDIFSLAAFVIIFVSLCVVAIAFFGCCGAVKESRCLLGIYLLILAAIFAGMIAAAVFAGKSDGITALKKPMMDSLERYDPAQADQPEESSWDAMQRGFKCCGVNNHTDWKHYNDHYGTGQTYQVPGSCCSIDHGINESDFEQCQKTPDSFKPKMPGCFGQFETFIKDHEQVILAVVGSTIGVMVLTFLLTLYMFCKID